MLFIFYKHIVESCFILESRFETFEDLTLFVLSFLEIFLVLLDSELLFFNGTLELSIIALKIILYQYFEVYKTKVFCLLLNGVFEMRESKNLFGAF